ncbi:hypothetical protein GR328_08480 [Microvirga makkahensis]|uniref:Uncharacterized protein n=1 Tax=Microvirga makkahensis TaxID=1128670 RepID=A0A7X3SNW1_9HYPH|nr:hypothetical protein [Microvirga makkahensis]
MRALAERALVERLATLPDFFVAEVRLDAAAARFVDFAAVFLAEDFTALRVAGLRAEVERADAVRAVDLRAVDFFAADREAGFAEVFLAAVFLAAVFVPDDFAADLAVVFLAAVFFAVVFLAAVLVPEDFAEDLVEDFAADLAVVFLAAVFLAAVLVPADFVLLRAEDVLAFFAVVLEPLLAPLVFLVLVAPVSPVNNAVSGFLLSVGIAASFKGLRVQPSRLQGNVVIPSGFRLTESVESRIRTFSVDTLTATAA